MPLLDELARFVSQRREQMGLSAVRLAHIAGVDARVVEDLLARRCADLDVRVAERIANSVGLSLGVAGQRRRRDCGRTAAELAAQTASTSYRALLPTRTLVEALLSGVAPDDFRPHLRTLLEEAPIGLLASLGDELEADYQVPAASTWKIMRAIAVSLACQRDIWA